MSNLDAALAWAEGGFFVFPCVKNGKRPACTNGIDDATNSPSRIRELWSDPDFNIGVAPARSNCFVLDVDPPLGFETVAELQKTHGDLPTTLTIKTPRGGLHYWFQGPCPSTVQKLGAKLDTRGTGGYVLVPPSVTADGSYEYAGETDEITIGPLWIAEAIRVASEATQAAADVELDLPENIERARQLLRNYVASNHVAVEGQGGDNRTYQVACEVLNMGLSADTALDVLDTEWNTHCVPPWDRDELETKLGNAGRYAQNDVGVWAAPPNEETFSHLTAHVAPPPDKKLSRFYPRDEGEQDCRPPPSWLLPNLLPEQGTAMMFGPSGQYKTFLALDLALVLASGIAGWGAEAREPGAVIYVSAEGTRAIERLRRPAWKKARQVAHAVPFYTIDTMPLVVSPHDVLEMIETIKARGIRPVLLILDTFARAMAGKNENDAKDTGDFIEAIETIKRSLGCTVLALHHTGKEEVRGARGSSALFAGLDTVLEVKSDTHRKLAVVTVRKQKDADVAATPWTFHGEICESSLVFNEIDTGTYESLSRQDDPLSQIRIGGALRELLAVTLANGVTTQVLATHLCPPLAADTPEDHERAVAAFARKLGLLAKNRLRAYTEGQGRELKWYVPSLDETATTKDHASSPSL